MNTQATVEVLTAEVRALMVGSRQITQSVAKQLDRVPLESMQPFGRIRIGSEERLVIGRHETGVLTVASYDDRPILDLSNLPGGCVVRACDKKTVVVNVPGHGALLRTPDAYLRLRHDGVSKVCRGYYCRCEFDWELPDSASDGALEHASNAWYAAREAFVPHAAAADLPLIVLAGLR